MIQILYIFGILLFLLLPIYFWMYFFENFAPEGMGKVKFFLGMAAGAGSSIFLFPDFPGIQKIYTRIFSSFFEGKIPENLLVFFLFLSLSFFLFLFGIFLFRVFHGEAFFPTLRQGIIFLVHAGIIISILAAIGYFFLFIFSDVSLPKQFSFFQWSTSKFSFLLVLYLFLAGVEEAYKFFAQYFSQKSGIFERNMILYTGLSIALGFSFLENIIYMFHAYEQFGLGKDLLGLTFMRGIFSLSLHVCSGMILLLGYKNSYKKLRIFAFSAFFAIVLHAMFNILLWYGFTVILLGVLLALYFLVSGILLPEEGKQSLS